MHQLRGTRYLNPKEIELFAKSICLDDNPIHSQTHRRQIMPADFWISERLSSKELVSGTYDLVFNRPISPNSNVISNDEGYFVNDTQNILYSFTPSIQVKDNSQTPITTHSPTFEGSYSLSDFFYGIKKENLSLIMNICQSSFIGNNIFKNNYKGNNSILNLDNLGYVLSDKSLVMYTSHKLTLLKDINEEFPISLSIYSPTINSVETKRNRIRLNLSLNFDLIDIKKDIIGFLEKKIIATNLHPLN